MWTFVVVGDLDGTAGDQRLGHAFRQQTRHLGLKIDQLSNRGAFGDLAFQPFEMGMIHGGVPVAIELGHCSEGRNTQAPVKACISSVLVNNNTQVKLRLVK